MIEMTIPTKTTMSGPPLGNWESATWEPIQIHASGITAHSEIAATAIAKTTTAPAIDRPALDGWVPSADSTIQRTEGVSGDSRWSPVKRRKGAGGAKRGKLFTKLARASTVAAREGGGEPDSNPALRTAVQKARSNSMPKDNIA